MSLDGEEKGKIVDRLRESLKPRLSANRLPSIPAAHPVEHSDREELDVLRRGADIYHVSIDSSHQFGQPLSFVRRVWRKILKPLLIRQVHYNSTNARLVEAMQAQIDRLGAENRALKLEVQGRVAQPLNQAVDRLRQNETSVRAQYDTLQAQQTQMQAQIDQLKSTEKQQSRAIVRLHKQVKALQAKCDQSA